MTVLSDLDPLRTYVEGVIIERPGSNGDPIGLRNHASEQTHQRNAEILIQKFSKKKTPTNLLELYNILAR